MIIKEYYRLAELKTRFEILFEDIQYYVNEGKLNIHCYRDTDEYIVGGWQKGKGGGFVGFARVTYRGLLKLNKKSQQNFVQSTRDNRVVCSSFLLLSKESVDKFTTDFPFSIELPSGPISSWSARSFDEIERSEIPAILMPAVGKLSYENCRQLLKNLNQSFTNSSPISVTKLDDLPTELIEKEIYLRREDICITHAELKSSGLLSGNNVSGKEMLQNKTLPPIKYQNEFQGIVGAIMLDQEYPSEKKIYRILCSELKILEDERKYDTENILSHMEGDVIIWIDRFGKQKKRRCGLGTLSNHMTKASLAINNHF